MIKIYYFTSTGNSLYVGKEIKKKINEVELISIKEAMKEKNFVCDSDIVGIIYPLHCMCLPIIVEEFLENLELKGNPYIFTIQVTGGGKSRNGFIRINEILSTKGFKLNNFEEIKYISNYTRMGKNPTRERAIKSIENEKDKLDNFIASIQNKEDKNKKLRKQAVNSLLYSLWKNKYKNKDKHFNVNSNCTGCKTCEKICPVDNIKLNENKPTWNGNCIDCMACINICISKAINIGNKTVKKNRYINPYIKRSELIR